MAIQDVDIPLEWQMRAILDLIAAARATGELVYVHCWGGVGRTGTVIGCLMREGGCLPDEVLPRIADARTETTRAHRDSPETDTQRSFVLNWPSGTSPAHDSQGMHTPTGDVSKIEQMFAEQFATWDIRLPPGAVARREPGHIYKRGWHIGFVWGEEDGEEFLDVLSQHRHPGDNLDRLWASGRTDAGEAMSTFVLEPRDPAERERVHRDFAERNARIAADLRARGLLPAPGQNLASLEMNEYLRAGGAGLTIRNHGGAEIRSMAEWKRLAPPASAHHWVEGRSAAELARSWAEGDGASRAEALLRQRPTFEGLTFREAIAEKTHFDGVGSGPRNHDLLVRATCEAGPVTIGIEAKADEPFDRNLAAWLAGRTKKTATSKAQERLDNLTCTFFGTTLGESPDLGGLGYQLLSALGGTLADARRDGAIAAVLLVHEFVTDKTDDERHSLNAKSLDAFVERFEPAERTGDHDAWLMGPWTVCGDGRWLPKAMPVYVGKLVSQLR